LRITKKCGSYSTLLFRNHITLQRNYPPDPYRGVGGNIYFN
jgi:hypothetical protein